MSTIAEVQFAHEDGALAYTLKKLPAVDAKIIRETSTEPAQSTYFLRFGSHNSGAIRQALAADHTVRHGTPISESEDRQVWRIEFADEARLLNPVVTSEGGFVLHAQSTNMAGDRWGWHERWLLPSHEALYTIWQTARDEGFAFDIVHFQPWDGGLSEYTAAETLTDEQRDALALAYERGYFTEPRETDLEALADELGISPSAVSGRLKRGMKLLIEESLTVNENH